MAIFGFVLVIIYFFVVSEKRFARAQAEMRAELRCPSV